MTIAGAKLFPKHSANNPLASISASGRSISVQRNHNLPQASPKATQSLKFSIVKELRRRRPYCVNDSQVAQNMCGFGARRPLNSPTGALLPLFFFYNPIVRRSKRRGSLNVMVDISEEAAIIDIEEKADGSILFKFMLKEQLLAVEHLVYSLLRATKDYSRDPLNQLITKNLDQFYIQKFRDGRATHTFYNGNVNCMVSSCNFDNKEANYSRTPVKQMMLKQLGSLVPGECSFSRIFIVSDSNVSTVKFSSEGLLSFLEEITGQSLYSQYEIENKGDGRDTSLISSDFTDRDQQQECLPCTTLHKEFTTSVMPTSTLKTVAMKMPLQWLAWLENVSECEAVAPIPVVFKVASESNGILSQGNTMPLNIRENIMVMPFPNHEKELDKEDLSPNPAAATKITNKNSLETFSKYLVPSRQNGRKRPLKKSGGKIGPRFKEPMQKSATNRRDLFSRSPFQVYELLLTYRFTNITFGDFKYKAVKKACWEIANVLNQLSVGLAGSGLAIVLFIISQMLKLNSIFDSAKFAALLRGFCLIWLSTAIQNVRTLILELSYGSSVPTKDQVRHLHREMKNLSVKALMVTALSLVGSVKYF